MRGPFIGILIFLALLILVCVFYSLKYKGKTANCVRLLLISIIIPMAGNLLLLLTQGETLCEWGYYIYFAGTAWMLFFAGCFAFNFCGYNRTGLWANKLMFVIALADTALVFSNLKTKQVLSLETVALEDKTTYYKLVGYSGLVIHLVLAYVMIAVVIVTFLFKILATPKLYVEKYTIILCSLILATTWESCRVFLNNPVKMSITGFAVCGLLVYYFALCYRPVFLISKMLTKVSDGISDAVFFFDASGRCVFLNAKATELFDITMEQADEAQNLISTLVGNRAKSIDYAATATRIVDGKSRFYRVSYHALTGSKQKLIGYFYSIGDFTDDEIVQRERSFLETHDRLTELYNREYFIKLVEKRLREDSKESYYLASCNIKDFKVINDVYGRDAGDEILNMIAVGLRKYACPKTIYCRLEADKFAALIRKYDYDEAKLITKPQEVVKLRSDMNTPVVIQVGVYEISDHYMPVTDMIDRTTMAIDNIKDDFTARLAYFTDTLRDQSLWEQKVKSSVLNALSEGKIVPFLQAQVDSSGTCVGAELLVRWDSGDGMVAPELFIPILEKHGMITFVDCFMWETAFEILQDWQNKGIHDMHVSINISPKDFYFIDVKQTLADLLDKYDIEPYNIHLEITETALMHKTGLSPENVQELRDMGFIVEMDDFGSGYSSLNMLKEMPIDILKVDMVFLSETRDPERAAIILQMIMNMADMLDMVSLIEGVENKEQFEMLHQMGCQYFQGYYFEKPLSLSEFSEKYVKPLEDEAERRAEEERMYAEADAAGEAGDGSEEAGEDGGAEASEIDLPDTELGEFTPSEGALLLDDDDE